jgi:hypothetical protein
MALFPLRRTGSLPCFQLLEAFTGVREPDISDRKPPALPDTSGRGISAAPGRSRFIVFLIFQSRLTRPEL